MVTARNYRLALAKAYALPVMLFLVTPILLPVVLGNFSFLPQALGFLAMAVLPIGLTGFFLAPTVGASLRTSKPPSFFLSALAAVSSSLVIVVPMTYELGVRAAAGAMAIFAFFAVPASVLGAIFFIGACQRLEESDSRAT